jgi:hypothetical protein
LAVAGVALSLSTDSMRWFSRKKESEAVAVTTMAHPSSNLVLDAPFQGRQISDAVSLSSPSRQESGRKNRRKSRASESESSVVAPSVGEVSAWPQLQPNPARQFLYVFQHRESKAVVVVRSTGDLASAKTLHSLRMASSLWRELDQVTVEEAVAEAESRRQSETSLKEQRQSPASSYHKPQQQHTTASRHTPAVQRPSVVTRLPAAASASSAVAITPSERAIADQQSEELELLGVKCR